MAFTNEISSVSDTQVQRTALNAVLRSSLFSKNPRLSALLQYLCERCFQGETTGIKEYDIATDVFGRSANFDQSTDAIVRVEMHRLRKKLKEFYAGPGADEPVEILLQAGIYLPEFVWRYKQAEQRPAPIVKTVLEKSPAASKSSRIPALVQPDANLRGRRSLAIGLAIAVIAALSVASAVFVRDRRTARHQANVETPMPPQPAIVPMGDAVRILCGASRGGYRDREGNVWGADAYFTGGTASDVPEQPIYRTADAFLFRKMRTGEFSYKIPLKSGVYEMRLYFADTSYTPAPAMEGGENVRVFNVLLNGEMLLPQFDIIADAGPNSADVRAFKDVSPSSDGFLHLEFSRLTDMPLLNAIEIVPAAAHHVRPIRILTQDAPVIDRTGETWLPDNYFLGGRIIARYGTVSGPEDPQIYGRERYGHFSYAIPVPKGRYAVTLHFAETYWGPKGPGGGGAGSRVFNVNCNGTALLTNFDMYKEAGAHVQITRTFHNLEPNAQGNLLLSFVPVKNYANVSAIDVVEEQN